MADMKQRKRSERIRSTVQAAVLDWRAGTGEPEPRRQSSDAYPPLESVLQPMVRRANLQREAAHDHDVIPSFTSPRYRASFFRTIGRLGTWFYVILFNLVGNGFDWLLRRSSLERKAVHLRRSLEIAGGTFVKIGQQAAMRIDLLPWAYCVELSRMHDRMVPFKVETALEAVERTTGRPWQDIFAVFDPKPIGSASIACVYQAELKDGSKVAVKVRRPEIKQLFITDLRVLDWLASFAEFLSVFRQGFTTNLRLELRETLMEEVDFRKEARFQDTFRRNSAKSGKDFFTAAKVYFEYSGEEVLVQEFVEGLWLWEVINAVETKRPQARATLRKLNIDPAIVARRIMWACFWSMDEHLFFHSDPHPANIVIRPNNELTFIDFGSCGSFNNTQRIALEQMALALEKQDAEGMALASLTLMEPIPLVDLPKLLKDAIEEHTRVLQTFNTPAEYTQYWERTSARQWVGLFKTAQKYNISLNLHMLRMIRATLLYDSIVLRLDNQLNRAEEYRAFMKDRAVAIRKRWRNDIQDVAGDRLLLRVEELGSSVTNLMLRAQSVLGKPVVKFGSTIDKLIFAMTVITRMTGRIAFVTFATLTVLYVQQLMAGLPVSITASLGSLFSNQFYLAFLVLMGILNIRQIIFRLVDRDRAA